MIKYVTWPKGEIEEIEVISESSEWVTLADNRRWLKRTEDSWNIFGSWQEAKDFLVMKAEDKVMSLEIRAWEAQIELKRIEEMGQG